MKTTLTNTMKSLSQTALVALTLTALAGCTKQRPAEFDYHEEDKIFSIKSLRNASITIETGDGGSWFLSNDSEDTFEVSRATADARLQPMFGSLSVSGKPESRYSVKLEVTPKYITAYKVVSDAAALTSIEQLITRPKDLFDNATPGGTSVACDVLLRLALLLGNAEYARAATEALEAVFPIADRYPSGFGFLLGVAEWRAGTPREIALTGDASALRKVVGETYLPHRVLVAGTQSADLPLMENRPAAKSLAYVCIGYACEEPISDPERLKALLG